MTAPQPNQSNYSSDLDALMNFCQELYYHGRGDTILNLDTVKMVLKEKIKPILESERSRLIDEIEATVRDIRWPDKGNGAKGSIMWSQFIGHEKALDKVKKILEEAKNG